jgi:hypothetical protein
MPFCLNGSLSTIQRIALVGGAYETSRSGKGAGHGFHGRKADKFASPKGGSNYMF